MAVLKRNGWLAMVLVAVCVLAVVADAQDKSIRRIEPGRKMALVIGNAAYTTQRQLTNPVNDAQAVARLLREELGFAEEHVQLRLDLETGRSINQALDGFAKELQGTDLAFFYYSGHGGQEGESRENYLLPTGFEAVAKEDLEYDALAVTKVRKRLAKAQLRVVVVDACRTNGGLVVKEGKTVDAPNGLAAAKIDANQLGDMQGELIAYAASPGQVATDRGAGLGLYARHLVAELQRPGVEFRQAFDRVDAAVHRDTGGEQHPVSVDQVYGYGAEFYFVPPEGPVVIPPPVEGRWEKDWRALENIKDPAMKGVVEEYIEDYESEPDARLWVKKARVVLATLEERQDAVAAWTAARVAGARADLVAFVARYGEVAPDLAKEAAGMLERLQEAELKVLEAGSSWKSPLGMEFAWIPAGDFEMGSPEGEAGREDDERQHGVRISEGFWMGRYEVTQGEWEAVMGSNPSTFKACRPRCPVESVSWEDVQGFIQKLNEDEREAGSGNRYRLPSEAEWEYAARAGSAGATPEGDLRILAKNNVPVLDDQAWYGGNSGVSYAGGYDCSGWEGKQYAAERCGPHPVGLKKANGWGLHDMLGNVWEWTADWYGEEYPSGMVTDPRGPSTGSSRVYRGGCWYFSAGYVRSATRSYSSPGTRYDNLGFRLVRTN